MIESQVVKVDVKFELTTSRDNDPLFYQLNYRVEIILTKECCPLHLRFGLISIKRYVFTRISVVHLAWLIARLPSHKLDMIAQLADPSPKDC